MTPTGISVGAMTVRATVSQMIKKLAPNNIEAGINILWSGPMSKRTICGTTRPTNPMGPLIATTDPVTKEALTNPIFWILGTSTPRLMADCEPELIKFKSLAIYIKMALPKNTGGQIEKTV